MGCRCVKRNIVQEASSILTHKYNFLSSLSRFTYRKKKELIYQGKAAMAVTNHMLCFIKRKSPNVLKLTDIPLGYAVSRGNPLSSKKS